MNGKTAKLIKKVAKARGIMHRRYINSLKQEWYNLNRHERAERHKEWQEEVEQANQKRSLSNG